VGVGSDTATLVMTVPGGEAVRLLTDPSVGPRAFRGTLVADETQPDGWAKDDQGSYLITGETDVTHEIEADSVFAPIPAGQARPLNLAVAGMGTVTAEIVPKYRRAWRSSSSGSASSGRPHTRIPPPRADPYVRRGESPIRAPPLFVHHQGTELRPVLGVVGHPDPVA
ncbi:hypothetical protein, partial [Thermocatellispora tengchongensis]|uniref:hypothetical protein n=1 Tax=Thermocatellispora tengchongensis TaxID=1073253 RepID=UPI0031E60A3C